MTKDIALIDPRLIVNTRGARPVTAYHANFLKESFLKNGYVSSNLLTCRVPSAREIADFYIGEPHLHNEEQAQERAQAVLKQPNAGGHVFCIDGLHRRRAALELIEEQILSEDFRFCAIMVQEICKEYEIALSISLNSSNEYSIKLSSCALVLQCSKYDDLVNRNGRKKRLSAAEVGRRMVQCGGSDKKLKEKAISAMAATRRQVIGTSRKLPCSALRYLDTVQETDPKSAEAAFTIANLKAIPKSLTDEEAVSLLQRMHNFYKTQIPIPKPMAPNKVPENCFYLRRAFRAIERFLNLCDFPKLPPALEYIAGKMKNTDKHDEALANCSYEHDELYDDLVQECEKSVTGGVSKIMIARRKLSSRRESSLTVCHDADGDKAAIGGAHEGTDSGFCPAPEGSFLLPSPRNDILPSAAREEYMEKNDDALADYETMGEEKEKRKLLRLSLVSAESLEHISETKEPPGWHLVNCGFEEFSKNRKEWSFVENCTDLALFDIPAQERNQDNIDKLIRNIGNSLRVTGVGRAFCTLPQFPQVVEAASKIGLSPIANPMVYVQDANKTRRLTFSLQPQNIVEYAAVFCKASRKSSEKHYFSTGTDYDSSVTSAWTNVVSNIFPERNRLLDSNGKPFNRKGRSKDLYKFILRQWCRPGGMFYNLFAKDMAAGLAAYDVGIIYIVIEEDSECFDAAKGRTFECVCRPSKRTISEEVNNKFGNSIERNYEPTTGKFSVQECCGSISSDEKSDDGIRFDSSDNMSKSA